MTAAETYFRVRPLSHFQWPLSFRYHVWAPSGQTQQVLTVDAPELYDQDGPSLALGAELWKRGVALATSSQVSLLWYEMVAWRRSTIPVPQLAAQAFGRLNHPPAPNTDAAQLVLHTGHDDDMGRRRFPIAGFPADWIQGRRLTHGGMAALELVGRMLMLGMASQLPNAPMVWLHAYPNLLPPGAENPTGVAFRTVEYVRACCLTDRAPDVSTEPWP